MCIIPQNGLESNRVSLEVTAEINVPFCWGLGKAKHPSNHLSLTILQDRCGPATRKGSQPACIPEVRIQSYCYFGMPALKSTMQVDVRSRFEFDSVAPKADTAVTMCLKSETMCLTLETTCLKLTQVS